MDRESREDRHQVRLNSHRSLQIGLSLRGRQKKEEIDSHEQNEVDDCEESHKAQILETFELTEKSQGEEASRSKKSSPEGRWLEQLGELALSQYPDECLWDQIFNDNQIHDDRDERVNEKAEIEEDSKAGSKRSHCHLLEAPLLEQLPQLGEEVRSVGIDEEPDGHEDHSNVESSERQGIREREDGWAHTSLNKREDCSPNANGLVATSFLVFFELVSPTWV